MYLEKISLDLEEESELGMQLGWTVQEEALDLSSDRILNEWILLELYLTYRVSLKASGTVGDKKIFEAKRQ
jgi:hypothetical protein